MSKTAIALLVILGVVVLAAIVFALRRPQEQKGPLAQIIDGAGAIASIFEGPSELESPDGSIDLSGIYAN